MLKDDAFSKLSANKYFFQFNSRFVFRSIPYPDNSVCFYLRDATNYNTPPRFATDISREIYDASTVTYIMFQLAVYMGFREIVLLGIDHNYAVTTDNNGQMKKDSVLSHFYKDTEKEDSGTVANIQRMTMGYEKAADFAKHHGIRIYNATRGGKLETFERRSLEDIFSSSQVF